MQWLSITQTKSKHMSYGWLQRGVFFGISPLNHDAYLQNTWESGQARMTSAVMIAVQSEDIALLVFDNWLVRIVQLVRPYSGHNHHRGRWGVPGFT